MEWPGDELIPPRFRVETATSRSGIELKVTEQPGLTQLIDEVPSRLRVRLSHSVPACQAGLDKRQVDSPADLTAIP